MKVFITNQYGYIPDKELAAQQNKFAKAAHELGFYEMGFFVCDLSQESDTELSKRLDGIIASVERDDIVILQLPTGNGQRFEKALLSKIRAYSGRKPLVLWQSTKYYYENHEQYSNLISDEKQVSGQLKNDALGLECKTFLLDFVHDNCICEDDAVTTGSEELIHIGFGLHDKTGSYSMWVGATMQSIIEHTDSRIVFHILHDATLSDANRRKLQIVAENGNDTVAFHEFDPAFFGGLNETIGRYTIGTMFRTMLPEVLHDVDRIIYLDADLFVNRDIKELWDIDISNYCLAAVPDYPTYRNSGTPYPVGCGQVKRKNYFNAGVLYMNLANMRKNGNTCELILKYLRDNPKAFLFDQDALNVVFVDNCLLLDETWNYFISGVRLVENAKAEKKIYHYAANLLVLYYKNEVELLYYKTILRTPWGMTEGMTILKGSIFRTVDRAEQLELLLNRVMQKPQKIIFYGAKSESMINAVKLLNINIEESQSSFYEHIEDKMLQETRNYIYIVDAGADNNKGIEKLKNAGLKMGYDYFITHRFMDVSKGGFIL